MYNLIGISGKIGSGKDTLAKLIQLVLYNKVYENKEPQVLPTPQALANISDIKPLYLSGWEIKKFAYKMKQIACLILGCTMNQLEDQNFKNSYLGDEWGEYVSEVYSDGTPLEDTLLPMKVRTFLQCLGTDAMRNGLHTNVWVNALFSDYLPIDDTKRASMGNVIDYSACPYPKWLITDMRFPNELEAIKRRRGILIRINNQYAPIGQQHESETALDHYTGWDEYIKNTGTIEDLYLIAKDLVNKYNLS